MNTVNQDNRIAGTVSRTTFRSNESGFNILRVEAEGIQGVTTVLGTTPQPVTDGTSIEARGKWVENPRYGRQFRADTLNISAPVRGKAIQRFLESSAIPGVGKTFAERIISRFGDRAFEIIDADPDRLLDVPGIGVKKRNQIVEALSRLKNDRDALAFMYGCGLSSSLVARIFAEYGTDASSRIMANPYSLTSEFWGVGFKTADKIAAEVGIARKDLRRIRAGVGYVLIEAASDGNCGLGHGELVEKAGNILEVPSDLICHAVDVEIREGSLIRERSREADNVYLQKYYALEDRISQQIRMRSNRKVRWGEGDKGSLIEDEERKAGITLSEDQRQAVSVAMSSGLVVITGGPGVGKTTIVNVMIRVLNRVGVKTGLCAPTGMAAKKLAQATGHDAVTIHRMLGYDPVRRGFVHRKGNPLDFDMLVVDETSMIDVNLMSSLLEALRDDTGLVLIGDVDQLPSIGPGNVLSDMIESGRVSVVRLNRIFRQASDSSIVMNATRIRKGDMPDLNNDRASDFYFISTSDADNCRNLIRTMVTERIPARFGLDAARDIQVLSPMRNGPVGVRSLNDMLRQQLVPDRASQITHGERSFAVGDKVMQLDNDYERDVFNGDIGYVAATEPGARSLRVRFDNRLVDYTNAALGSLDQAFAITIHKSQGSEYPAVIIPMMTIHRIMLTRRLLYTAITRGRQLVVLVGQPYAIRVAVSDMPLGENATVPDSRITRLGMLLA